MTTVVMALALLSPGPGAFQQPDYAALWRRATPVEVFLDSVKAQQDKWRPRFANAAIDADTLNEVRALPGRRRLLVVADDRCADSAWSVPYLAKLAAVVPDKLELRVLRAAQGRRIQAAHLSPDGRMATPTVAVLDEDDTFLGAWVERPSELQHWYLENKEKTTSDERYEHLMTWYAEDAGRSTIREVLAILRQRPVEGK